MKSADRGLTRNSTKELLCKDDNKEEALGSPGYNGRKPQNCMSKGKNVLQWDCARKGSMDRKL